MLRNLFTPLEIAGLAIACSALAGIAVSVLMIRRRPFVPTLPPYSALRS